MPKRVTFGSELRRLRRADSRKPSIVELAPIIGVTLSYLSDVERDAKAPPSPAKIYKLLEYLNVPHEYNRMVELASVTRKSIEFSLKELPDNGVRALMTLARRTESGDMSSIDWEKLLSAMENKDEGK